MIRTPANLVATLIVFFLLIQVVITGSAAAQTESEHTGRLLPYSEVESCLSEEQMRDIEEVVLDDGLDKSQLNFAVVRLNKSSRYDILVVNDYKVDGGFSNTSLNCDMNSENIYPAVPLQPATYSSLKNCLDQDEEEQIFDKIEGFENKLNRELEPNDADYRLYYQGITQDGRLKTQVEIRVEDYITQLDLTPYCTSLSEQPSDGQKSDTADVSESRNTNSNSIFNSVKTYYVFILLVTVTGASIGGAAWHYWVRDQK